MPAPLRCGLDEAVDRIIAELGKDIRIGVPLGLGKPVELINALYQRAQRDATLQLTVLTALSLERPQPKGLEAALLTPFLDRVFDGVPVLQYAVDQTAGRLPPNVRIVEFFIAPGSRLNDLQAQRDYISTNYTFAARDVFGQGCNLVAQMVAPRQTEQGVCFSLSSNPDTGPELMRLLRAAQASGTRRSLAVALVNPQLPYMSGDAEVAESSFDIVLDDPAYDRALFSTPKTPVGIADYAIGLQASTLVRDGGTLQIGIGSLGDAIAHCLRLRHVDNAAYCSAVQALLTQPQQTELAARIGGTAPFELGLYGASEMFVDGFWELMQAGVLKREVYGHAALQRVVERGRRTVDAALLDALVDEGLHYIGERDLSVLQHHGVLRADWRYQQGELQGDDGERVSACLVDPPSRATIASRGLGPGLQRGVVMHGGFFLGPRRFYAALRDMTQAQRDRIAMTGVEHVNQLDLDPPLYRAQRRHARFINTGMMATLSGAVVSDGLADGRVVSGVGGQYNFVAQAHQLPDARSILLVRAVRESGGQATSNIVFNYGHCTIPRHLRDIVISEYGIADLRGKTDRDVAKAMIGIADSRFQGELLAQAQQAGKIERQWQLPASHRYNTPQRLAALLGSRRDVFPVFPFGHEFTAQELRLAQALKAVQARVAALPRWRLLIKAARSPAAVDDGVMADLRRVQLQAPRGLQQRVARALLIEALQQNPGDASQVR